LVGSPVIALRTVTLAWRDLISSSSSIFSTSTIWKRVSGNVCKIFITIQRSVQTLWPLRTITLAWRDKTSSPSIDSTSTKRKKGLRKHQLNFYHDQTVGSNVLAPTNRYSSLAQPDLLLTEYRYHIHYMEKGIRKLL
jgi:hypothetical protein